MKDELIVYDTAKLAKEKGFNWKVTNWARNTGSETVISVTTLQNMNDSKFGNHIFAIPTQSLLKRWFREVHEISIHVDDFYTDSRVRYDYSVGKLGHQDDNPQGVFLTYELALEAALVAAFELIK